MVDNNNKQSVLNHLALGKATDYQSSYNPSLLQAIPRSLSREELGIVDSQPFVGKDVWHAYELSWLNAKGKPVVALGRFKVSADSPNIVESKSFKLYLNSINQSRFESEEDVIQLLKQDLSTELGADVNVELFAPDNVKVLPISALPGLCIDGLDIEIDGFDLNPTLLRCDGPATSETLHSHLLKSNCLITNQPDWASIVISYSGNTINHAGLLRYLISFRQHNEFHEQCVERIFIDIWKICQPQSLSVQALYTRRGGLDINPFRASNNELSMLELRINRQ